VARLLGATFGNAAGVDRADAATGTNAASVEGRAKAIPFPGTTP
jgi:hypothetical protein